MTLNFEGKGFEPSVLHPHAFPSPPIHYVYISVLAAHGPIKPYYSEQLSDTQQILMILVQLFSKLAIILIAYCICIVLYKHEMTRKVMKHNFLLY